MAFDGYELIPKCLSLLFTEIKKLPPDIIVLQGTEIHWHFFERARGAEPQSADRIVDCPGSIKKINWDSGHTSYVLPLKHPAARGEHSFTRQWPDQIVPMIKTLEKLLQN